MTTTEEINKEAVDMAEAAWGIIAFAYSTPDAHDKADWREAVERWRDRYHALLDALPNPPTTADSAEPRS